MSVHLIEFATGLNASSASGLREVCCKALNDPQIAELHIHFSCTGGPNFIGFGLYHFLKSCHVPVTLHNVGSVESMGVVVFLGGERRRACAESRFLLHPLHWYFEAGSVDITRLSEYAARLKDDVARFASIFNARTKGAPAPIDVTPTLEHTYRILNAQQALDCGLIHEIAEATIPAGSTKWWVNG